MGTCWSQCCPIGTQNYNRRYIRTVYFDAESPIEFENLIDEAPKYPNSISSWLSFRRNKLSKEEETLELEEEAAIEARREAIRVAKLVHSPEIMNPARLVFHSENYNWLEDNPNNWNIAGEENVNKDKPTDEKLHKNKKIESKCFFQRDDIFPLYGRFERLNTLNSTPPSSVDLEWENEAGLTPPTHVQSMTDDDVAITDTASNCSRHSTPGSNELEWDGDFSGAQENQIDLETENLICEIERMTAQALQETDPSR